MISGTRGEMEKFNALVPDQDGELSKLFAPGRDLPAQHFKFLEGLGLPSENDKIAISIGANQYAHRTRINCYVCGITEL